MADDVESLNAQRISDRDGVLNLRFDTQITNTYRRSPRTSLIDEHGAATITEKFSERIEEVRGTEPGTAWYHQQRRAFSRLPHPMRSVESIDHHRCHLCHGHNRGEGFPIRLGNTFDLDE
jgi:hypothetical protein